MQNAIATQRTFADAPPVDLAPSLALAKDPIELETPQKDHAFYLMAAPLFKAITGKNLQLLVDDPDSIEDPRISCAKTLEDYAKLPLPANYFLETDNIHDAVTVARALGMQIVIVGTLTSATENFGPPGAQYDSDKIIAIKPKISNSETLQNTDEPKTILKSNEVQFREAADGSRIAKVGAGVIPEHLNDLVKKTYGRNYYVPIDITTRNQAQSGSVYVTGGMGPSRIRPHEIIESITISDSNGLRKLTGEEIKNHQGLLGLTGAIVEIEFKIFEVPANQFGFHVPLRVKDGDPKSKWEKELAKLQAKLLPSTELNLEDGRITSDWKNGFIDGMEIITRQELEMLVANSAKPEVKSKARQLLEALDPDSDFFVYITGRAQENLTDMDYDSRGNPVQMLFNLMEREEIGEPIPESDLKVMASAREEIPDLAKQESKNPSHPAEIIFSTSTDVNTCISQAKMEELSGMEYHKRVGQMRNLFHRMLAPYANYEAKIAALRETLEAGMELITRRYGHGHRRNLDPHTRITLKSDLRIVEQARHDEVVALIKQFKQELIAELLELRESGEIDVNIGEKGIPPGLNLLTTEENARILATLNAANDNSYTWRTKGTKLEAMMAKSA
jgi:hypothetical protein